MGSPKGALKTHKILKQALGEESYIQELKKRAYKGGSVRSDAKKEAARLREQRKREARENSDGRNR